MVEAFGKLCLIALVICMAIALVVMVPPMIDGLKTVNLTLPAAEAGWSDAQFTEAFTTFEDTELAPSLVIVDPDYSHGDLKHPGEAPLVRECLNKKGAYKNFLVDRKAKRFLRVCWLDNGQFGFQIVDQIGKDFWEVTAYIKQEIRTLENLNRYIDKIGYSRFKGLIQ